MTRSRRIDWKVFTILLVAGLIGVIAILPYMFDLLRNGVFEHAPASEMPLGLVVPLALIQNGILLAATILIGMILSERIGLRMPLIRAWARRDAPSSQSPGTEWAPTEGRPYKLVHH